MAIISKHELAECFQDTLRFIEENETLREATEKSKAGTKFYPADFSEEVDVKKAGRVRVEEGRTLQAALALHDEFPGKKIAVLNFAAPSRPGGGVWSGCHAQEESICRSSTLYPTLDNAAMKEVFYYPHKQNYDFRGWDDCIYSPDVVVCKDDSDGMPQRLNPEKFINVDVITCAAPHLRGEPIKAEDMLKLHIKRAKNILRVAAHNGVDIFVGGAFGCGAFHNDPGVVAWAWREAMKEYGRKFDLIDFVIYISDYELKRVTGEINFYAFRNEFAGE